MLLRSLVISVVIAFSAVAADEEEASAGSAFTWRLLKKKAHYVMVEEVDGEGRSSVRTMELPEDDSEEVRWDEERRREQRLEWDVARGTHLSAGDAYGCGDETEKRKCLMMRRKWLRDSYRSWREAMRRIMDDIDGRIRNLSEETGKDSWVSELASVPSPGEGKV